MTNSPKSGFENEIEFSQSLHQKQFHELGANAAQFIKQLYPKIESSTIITAIRVGGMGLKPDITVSVEDYETNVSLKKGSGNSVHQETIPLFLLYCKDNLQMSETIQNSFLAYLYGDGTLDGKGNVEDRLEGEELRKEYYQDIVRIQQFLKENARPLIERFLVYGRRGKELNIKADYIYHGFIYDGVWCPLDEAVDFLVDKAKTTLSSSTPTLGPLTLQPWHRNFDGNPKSDHRRNSIQIKWGSKITEYIKEINNIYLAKIKQNPSLANPKIFGDNSHGFKNAKDIARGLDGCRVRNLRGSLLGLINNVFNGAALTDVVSCKLIKGKPDLSITVGKSTKNISIFIGNGNSVHQEPFSDFVLFCKNELNMTETEEKALRFIYYGDGTLDGSGLVENRIRDSRSIKKLYPKNVEVAQAFFDQHRRILAKRFLITGKYKDEPEADYVFHGDVHHGISISYKDILDYIENFNDKRYGLLSIGPLSFQMWNRNTSGEAAKEHKRNSLQVKWPSMPERIREAYAKMRISEVKSKLAGINAEYELVSILNSNRTRQNPLWNYLCMSLNIDLEDIFAMRVSRQVYSNFLGQKIFPKSDIYLCKAKISEEILETMGYALDEDLAEEYEIDYVPISGSGISCKIATSNKFTYSKMSVLNFNKIFGEKLLGAGASIFVRSEDIKLNATVLNAWKVSEVDFLKFIDRIPEIHQHHSIETITEKEWSVIKGFCNSNIENIIKTNAQIGEMIFTGKGLYEDPYYAPILFSTGNLKTNTIPDKFNITTGSGRHKGKFTIVVKPTIYNHVDSID